MYHNYVKCAREKIGDSESAALVIMDIYFKGQKNPKITGLLEDHNIHVGFIPPNTTDKLQPMDVAVNKPAKDFLKKKFEEWYSEEVTQHLQGVFDIVSVELNPADLTYAKLSASWLVEMADYIAGNPQLLSTVSCVQALLLLWIITRTAMKRVLKTMNQTLVVKSIVKMRQMMSPAKLTGC